MFEQKEKEPKLSEKMKSIIERSMRETRTGAIDDIYRYKYKIMKMLTTNDDVLRTLHCAELETNDGIFNGDAYRYICIFDYLKLPDLKDKVKNYICFEVEDSGYDGLATKRIIFRTVSHIDDCKTDWGINRQDLLAAIIKSQFDWSNEFGMHIERNSDRGYITNDGYMYREIIYKTTNLNNIHNKINNYQNHI